MRDANAVDERVRFLLFHEFEKAFEIIHDIQQSGHKIPQRLSPEIGALAVNTAAIVIKIGEGAQMVIVF